MSEKILIIGGGNMGSSLARGLAHARSAKGIKVTVHDTHKERLHSLEKDTGVHTLTDLDDAKLDFDAVVLCIKPQDLPDVADKLSGRLDGSRTVVITILAGISVRDIERRLGFDGAVVRSMPNLPATVLKGTTALAANEQCGEVATRLAETIFGSVGETHWLKESLLDAVTGLSGSGPAYLFMVIEALTDGAVKMGIPRASALQMAVQTVAGAAALLQESGSHPAYLKDRVTTPGGTTIHAVHELEERGLRAMLISAVETATRQSARLREAKE